MMSLDGWDIALAAVGGYIAVVALVRLMHRRRDALIAELLQQAEVEQRKKKDRQRQADRDQVRQRPRQQETR